MTSQEGIDYPLSGAEGNAESATFTNYGCPVFSSGETWISEMMFVRAQEAALDWMQMVALEPDYVNPVIAISFADKEHLDDNDFGDKFEVTYMDKTETAGDEGGA